MKWISSITWKSFCNLYFYNWKKIQKIAVQLTANFICTLASYMCSKKFRSKCSNVKDGFAKIIETWVCTVVKLNKSTELNVNLGTVRLCHGFWTIRKIGVKSLQKVQHCFHHLCIRWHHFDILVIVSLKWNCQNNVYNVSIRIYNVYPYTVTPPSPAVSVSSAPVHKSLTRPTRHWRVSHRVAYLGNSVDMKEMAEFTHCKYGIWNCVGCVNQFVISPC